MVASVSDSDSVSDSVSVINIFNSFLLGHVLGHVGNCPILLPTLQVYH